MISENVACQINVQHFIKSDKKGGGENKIHEINMNLLNALKL